MNTLRVRRNDEVSGGKTTRKPWEASNARSQPSPDPLRGDRGDGRRAGGGRGVDPARPRRRRRRARRGEEAIDSARGGEPRPQAPGVRPGGRDRILAPGRDRGRVVAEL